MQLFAQSDDLFIGVKGVGSLTSTIEPVFYSFFFILSRQKTSYQFNVG